MTIEEKLISRLIAKGFTIAAGESCTGGLFISELIGAEGASDVVDASFATYSDAAKCRFLGVKPESLKAAGAVSELVAGEMAAGAAKAAGADVGVGITGYAGGVKDKTALDGTVCFGFYVQGFVSTVKVRFEGTRNAVRKRAAAFALNSLYNILK